MKFNYGQFIKEKKLVKTTDFVVNIPTFQAYEITKKTISDLKKQQGVSFDINVIGASGDVERLAQDFPDINYIIATGNYGSSGNQALGIYAALEVGYDYICLTDNDAILIGYDSLNKMVSRIKRNDIVGLVPKHIDMYGNLKNEIVIRLGAFHYFLVKKDVFKKIDIHNFYIFLYGDDASLFAKINSVGKIIVFPEAEYHHDLILPRSFSNFYSYYFIRGALIIVFRESHIPIELRMYSALGIVIRCASVVVNALADLDIKYIYTIPLAFLGFFRIRRNYQQFIPKNKYRYEIMDKVPDGVKAADGRKREQLFIWPKYIKMFSKYKGKWEYFVKVRNG